MALQHVIVFTVFFFALGACVGSFLNVVIWRLPNLGREVSFLYKRGALTLNWPPSHCPTCDAPIRWFQNIPMLSYTFLKGRCANCRTQIPIRYPLVELSAGVMFAAYFLASFVGQWQQYFTDISEPHQAAAFGVHLVFIAALLAASAIDIDLFIIPLSIPWMLAGLGVLAATLINSAAFFRLPDEYWHFSRGILGGAIGLGIANVLLMLKLIPRSFNDPEPDDQQTKASPPHPAEEHIAPPPKFTRFWPSVTASVALVIAAMLAWLLLESRAASCLTLIAGILIFLLGVLPRDADQPDVTDEVLEEVSEPRVRREIYKELPFFLVPVVCALIGHLFPIQIPQSDWLARLLGSLAGLLVGGGAIWFLRIAGTIWLGREAMGMGDAHLMAGVGAVVGPVNVIVAYFVAPFAALLWSVVLVLLRRPNILPYGPWLSIASILALFMSATFICWFMIFSRLLRRLVFGE